MRAARHRGIGATMAACPVPEAATNPETSTMNAPRQRRSPHLGALAGLAFALALSVASAQAAPAALVTDVVGDSVFAPGSEPVRLLAEVAAGSVVRVAANGQLTLFQLADGSEYTVRGPGRWRVGTGAPEPQDGAAAAQKRAVAAPLREVRLRTDRVAQGGIVMRSSGRPALLTPVNETVLDRDVRFAWDSFGPGASYQFELVDQAGQKLLQAETADTELRLPSAVQLQAGQTYYWAVRGRGTTAASPAYRVAEFRVVDADTRRRIEAARPAADAPFSERVLFAALLEDAGARTDAGALRRALAAERPAAWAPPQ
jgi:hypothetical protein